MNDLTLDRLVLSPLGAFCLVFIAILVLARAGAILSFKKRTGKDSSTTPYACGEESITHRIQPDYSQFFPFAFFFTILHVAALVVTTVPMETVTTFTIAALYIMGAVTGLAILFRR